MFRYWEVLPLGTPIEAIQQEVDRVALPEDLQNNGEHYGLKVKGDSMIEAGIADGDTVIIKKVSNVDNGQIAVVLIDDQEATLKEVKKETLSLLKQQIETTELKFTLQVE